MSELKAKYNQLKEKLQNYPENHDTHTHGFHHTVAISHSEGFFFNWCVHFDQNEDFIGVAFEHQPGVLLFEKEMCNYWRKWKAENIDEQQLDDPVMTPPEIPNDGPPVEDMPPNPSEEE
jgi:hypothetical protein